MGRRLTSRSVFSPVPSLMSQYLSLSIYAQVDAGIRLKVGIKINFDPDQVDEVEKTSDLRHALVLGMRGKGGCARATY